MRTVLLALFFSGLLFMPHSLVHAQDEMEASDDEACIEQFDDRELGRAACQGEVHEGMTPEMVREAWGDPRSVRSDVVMGYIQAEEWAYGSFIDRKIVYFVERRVHDVLVMED